MLFVLLIAISEIYEISMSVYFKCGIQNNSITSC
jgi:hypothetical protein